MSSLLKKLKSMNTPLEETQRSEFLREVILFLSAQPCGWTKREERSKNLEFAREVAASLLEKAANTSLKDILISTERLAETTSSLNCYSKLTKESEYLIISLSKLITRYTQKNPCIITSLRNPIPYLRSRYCRTTIQRQMINERRLTPKEYIQKQAALELNHPGTSSLMTAMHAEFIKQLQKHAFVKAFGFEELLTSDDAFALMGLQGEEKYAFRDLPRENKIPFTKEQEKTIEVEITKALKQYGLYDRIMKAQMFD